jgi:hypothetical protein
MGTGGVASRWVGRDTLFIVTPDNRPSARMTPMKATRTFVLLLFTAMLASACNPASITAPQEQEQEEGESRHPVIGGSGG